MLLSSLFFLISIFSMLALTKGSRQKRGEKILMNFKHSKDYLMMFMKTF